MKLKAKQRRSLTEICVTAGLFAAVAVADHLLTDLSPWLRLLLYLAPYAVIGRRVLWKALRNMSHGHVFDENFLMSLATVGALATGEYPEAVFVMLFYRVGELFEEIAVGKSRASIAALMDIRPDTAHVVRGGETVTVSPEEVAVGEVILIRPGERIPLDGVVLAGAGALDTVALTGESLPRDVAVGDAVISGCINAGSLLRVEVTKAAHESTVSKILELVENAGERKAQSERFISRFAHYYTPAVVLAAVALAVLPPLLLGATNATLWREWVGRALSFLVVSCPCALVISVPLSFFGGIGGASRQGILIKGARDMEALAACDTVAFDKTGTLTKGAFSVVDICPTTGIEPRELSRLAALAELHSTHPIARALVAACPDHLISPTEVEEMAGHGVRACANGRVIWVGNPKLMASMGLSVPAPDTTGTVVHVAADGAYLGYLTVADTLREDAAAAIESLRACGIKHTVMLTGDNEGTAASVAQALGITEYRANLLPADKVDAVESLLTNPNRRGKVAFVGDGINDAPVLARADVGIAMGGMGSDAAIEAADVVIMHDRPSAIPTAIRISRRTLAIVKQNVALALSVKAAVLALSAMGLSNLWLAVFADVGVAVLAILNAMRTLGGRGVR